MLLFMYLPAEGSSFESHRVCSSRMAHRLPIPVEGRGFISLPYLSIWGLRPLLWYVVRSIRRVFLRRLKDAWQYVHLYVHAFELCSTAQRNSNCPWTPCASFSRLYSCYSLPLLHLTVLIWYPHSHGICPLQISLIGQLNLVTIIKWLFT